MLSSFTRPSAPFSGKPFRLAVALSITLAGGTLSSAAHSDSGNDSNIYQDAKPVIFVGNNWEGSIDVIETENYVKIGRINGIPDKYRRMAEIIFNPFKLLAFQAIRHFIGEGHDQLVDDMYSTPDGRLLIVSRPSYADVVAINIATNDVEWRFPVKGIRSDHMAISPDGSQVAVSASTGKVVHILDVETGEELGQFPSGDSPHENVYSKDGSKIYHASIGMVFTPLDVDFLDFTKGKRRFQVVDTASMEIIKQFDMADKLREAGLGHLSPAVRPMAHTPDERMFYFQLSFLHGFIEYDMLEDKITRLAHLPNLIPDLPITQYVNDSAHHGIAMNGAGDTLCVAGTMDDYVALVNRETFEYQILTDLGEKPYWVTSDRSGENCYISWSDTDQMSVINYESGEEVIRVDVGDHPQRIREGYVPIDWVGYY
ncbi:YncE family protein [Hahella ganghwensis]|uniref:YncE family protein n=1 Tax=Hahella ganghwensis TaxID=286420 RepID=UPI00035FABDA|nr:hypothetical protein [Hahella ganghwensis]